MRSLLALLLLAQDPSSVRNQEHGGWPKALHLEAKKIGVAAILVPEIGARLVSYGRGGENILFDNPDYHGKTTETSDLKELQQGYTGYQIDIGPELRRLPAHPKLWIGKWLADPWKTRDGIDAWSPHDAVTGLSLNKSLRLDPIDGSLYVVQTMKNVSGKAVSYCFWDRTLCAGGGFAFFPLNRKSARPKGWGLVKDGKYVDADHENVKVLDGVLVAKAEGKPSKVGADSDAGWIAYARGKQLFVKFFPVFRGAPYTDDGNTVELYWDAKVAELEPLSPEVELKPGAEYVFRERWILLPLEKEPATHEEARALVGMIPENPFRQK
jgi:hypothetical protein